MGNGLQKHIWFDVFFGSVLSFSTNIVFEGLLEIHNQLMDPFGTDSQDFPREMYLANLWRTTHGFILQGENDNVPQVLREMHEVVADLEKSATLKKDK